ncbi:nuclear transport factor 2 family protein [Puniceibacterium confluentis]|uniref:nuclear transport factor 2 family protein n=1 Tax=Puniceibacterium confluentis TaxID=1958944 RepID=UPI0011B3D632|nr:nuclear transport factor 2 family protein [Puniceibacterium confluentis]
MKQRLTNAAVAAALMLTLPCGAQADDGQAKEILNRHNAAFGAGDVSAMLADYAEDAVFITPMGVFRGHAEIGSFFDAVIAEFAKPGASFEVLQTAFDDNVAYFAWKAETAENVYEVGGDTLVIADGKIATQTLTLKAVPKK